VTLEPLSQAATDGLPPSGTLRIDENEDAIEIFDISHAALLTAQDGEDVRDSGDVRDLSFITVNSQGLEVARRNAFSCWVSKMSLFEPSRSDRFTGVRVTWSYDFAIDSD